MRILKNRKMIVIQPVTHYSIVTVVNWALYQPEVIPSVTQSVSRAVTHPSANRHKEELKEVESLSQKQKPPEFDSPKDPDEQTLLRVDESRKPEPNPAINENALHIYEWYSKHIVEDQSVKLEAIKSIKRLLKKGHRETDLGEAMAEYANSIERNINPKYIIGAHNFFGGNKRYVGFGKYKGGMGKPIPATPEKTAGPAQDDKGNGKATETGTDARQKWERKYFEQRPF